jgi:hypothetical protein
MEAQVLDQYAMSKEFRLLGGYEEIPSCRLPGKRSIAVTFM